MKILITDSILAAFEDGKEYFIQWDLDDRPFIFDEPKDSSLPTRYYIEDLLYHHVKFTVK